MSEIQLVVFNIEAFTCAINIRRVQEINRKIDINIVSTAPDFVKGVINLRGDIVTIIDLHKKLQLKNTTHEQDKRYIIANWEEESVGLQVDSICDILAIDEDDIVSVPHNLNSEISQFFSGVYHSNDQLIGILDIDNILGVVHGQ